MNFIRLIVITFFLVIPFHAFSQDVKEYKIKNGLKVLIIENHKAPIATFQIWYRVGLKDEPIGKSGISHFLEHMMFKGTPKYSSQDFTRIVQINGGTDNAYTTNDYTVYYEVFPSDKIMLAIDLEADRMKNLLLQPEEVASEKKVVMEERRLEYDDVPRTSLMEEVVALSFKVHPYQRLVIGPMGDIQSIKRDDLNDFYKAHYTPDNAFIIVAGDVKTDEMIAKIEEVFGDIPVKPQKKKQIFTEPEQQGERRVLLKREAKLPYILIAYHTPSYPDKDSYPLTILDAILSNGKSSRFYQHIVYEKQLALDANSEYDEFLNDLCLFFIDATVVPEKGIKVLEDAIYAEIEKIKREPPFEYEIQKAKNQIEASFIFDQDSIEAQAEKYGMFEMLGDWRLIEKYLKGIRSVMPEDVTRVAKKYLHEDNRIVGIIVLTDVQE
jgi:zinc protease